MTVLATRRPLAHPDLVDTRYEQRKLDGRCTRGSCKAKALPDGQLCASHKASEAKRKSADARRRYQTRRANGMCGDCGHVKTKQARCAACKLKYETARLSSKKDATILATPASDRIAAATRVDATGRSRYHGQMRRGGPTTAMREEQDLQTLRWAVEEIRKSIEGLGLLDLPRFAEALKSERAAARRAALSQAALAIRLVEEVLDRNRYSDAATEMVPR